MDRFSAFYLLLAASVIVAFFLIKSVYGYSAPSSDNVTLVLGQRAYSAPSSDNVTLVLGLSDVPADSCTYSSGDWLVQCSDACVITSPLSVTGNVILNGSGSFYTDSDIEVSGSVTLIGGCSATCQGGCFT